jgi:hypothetical protein
MKCRITCHIWAISTESTNYSRSQWTILIVGEYSAFLWLVFCEYGGWEKHEASASQGPSVALKPCDEMQKNVWDMDVFQ